MEAKQLLREKTGRLLLVCTERNEPAGLIQWARTVPLEGRVFLDWTAGIEHLHVLEFRIL